MNPIGGSLYPWVLWRRALMRASPRRRYSTPSVQFRQPDRIAHLAPPWPDWGLVLSLNRGFRHELRCLALGSAVARPARDSSHPDNLGCSALERDRCWIAPKTQQPPYTCAHLTWRHLLRSAGHPSVRHADLGDVRCTRVVCTAHSGRSDSRCNGSRW